MKRLLFSLTGVAAWMSLQAAEPVQPVRPFEFQNGDRVVFLGDTLLEREKDSGYIESLLTVQQPDRDYVFRNLAWSGDLPNGRSRASFDWNQSPDVWFQRLTNQVAEVDPTVVFLGYGMAASLDDEMNPDQFKASLRRLVRAIRSNAKHDVRFVFLSPIAHQNIEGSVADVARHNEELQEYADAVKEVAEESDGRFINLFRPRPDVIPRDAPVRETSNGIHPTPVGYGLIAESIAAQLGWYANSWRAGITEERAVRSGSFGSTITNIVGDETFVSFDATADQLLSPVITDDAGETINGQPRVRLQFVGLEPGNYDLLIDGRRVITGPSSNWVQSLTISRGPDFHQAEALRRAVVRKNALFMNRWRPQNSTYLFGFRKHEQGQNAGEVAQFDADVARADEEIRKLKHPASHRYQLVRAAPRASIAEETYPDRNPVVVTHPKVIHHTDPKPKIPFEVADGFEVTLFAEDPLLAKPIQMNWDAVGNLIVASSETYPQIKPGAEARDKIVVIKDADADGTADMSEVIMDGLLIPTGVESGDGGYYVGNSTELIHVQDANHDYAPEGSRVVLSAFGTEDTHHLLHTLRFGFDGRLYMNQSIYIHSHVETPTGIVRLNSGGVLGYRAPTDELEIFLRGFCNPWGHVFDRYGQSFVTDGAGFQGVSWGVPGAMYFTYAGASRILDSISPGAYPKFSGLEIIDTPNFPADWQGDLITCDFRAHRVVRFKLEEEGAGYVTREMPDLLRTTDVTFRPIDVKLGPDGALYIADWTNPIIQHGEVDFRDERRDKTSGRIWRVAYKGGEVMVPENYQYLPTVQLFEKLNSPNAHVRKVAGRVLAERGQNSPEFVQMLKEWTDRQDSDLKRLRTLWVYQSIDRINPRLLEALLKSTDPGVRAGATRVLAQWQDWMDGSETLLATASKDEHPRVRLEAVRGLAKKPTSDRAALILSVADTPMDKFLEYATWLSINDVADAWVAAIESGEWKPAGKGGQLEFGLKSIRPELASRALALLLPTSLPADGSGGWIELIGGAGTVTELNRLYQQTLQKGFDETALVAALNALNQASRTRQLKPTTDLDQLDGFLKSKSAAVRASALQLSGAWKQLTTGLPEVAALAAATSTSERERELAFQTLREIGTPACVDVLLPLTAAPQPPAIRLAAVGALAGIDLNRALPLALSLMNDLSTEEQALQLWRVLLNNKGAAKQLAARIKSASLSPAAASAGLRAVREGGRNEPELLQELALISNTVPVADAELSNEALLALAATVMKEGDPVAGERVYRRPELGCTSCHAIGGVGGRVGPDLTSIGGSAPADYLIESLLYPNRKIKEGYHSVIIETKDEFEYSGVLVRETDTEIVIRNAADQEMTVAKNNIARKTMGASLMPAGLVDQLSDRDRKNLFRFLAELGKPGAFDASKGNVARQWKLRAASHRDEQFGANIGAIVNEPGWAVAATLVDGRLLNTELEGALHDNNPNRATGMVGLWLSTSFRTAQAGSISLEAAGLDAAEVWVDGKPVANLKSVRLPAGEHRLLVRLKPKELPAYVKIQSDNAIFLSE